MQKYSFVIPLYNEEESLEAFYQAIIPVAEKIDKSYEIIFIDDGSTDKSLSILKQLSKKNNHLRIFSFRRNLGKAEALGFGFSKAQGDYIITLDADLQDKPSEIVKLIEKSREGVEVVSGWRKNRRDKSRIIIISRLFNRIVGIFFNTGIHDYNCGLKLYTQEAAKRLKLYGGLHRFIPFLAYQQGFTIGEVIVEHEPRRFGKSKYGFSKIWKDIPDIFTMLFLAKYSKRPLHFFGIVGGSMTLVGIIIISYLTVVHYIFNQAVGRRPLFFMGILFVIAGFQIFFTGFLADLMINIAHSSRNLDEENLHYPLRFSTDKL